MLSVHNLESFYLKQIAEPSTKKWPKPSRPRSDNFTILRKSNGDPRMDDALSTPLFFPFRPSAPNDHLYKKETGETTRNALLAIFQQLRNQSRKKPVPNNRRSDSISQNHARDSKKRQRNRITPTQNAKKSSSEEPQGLLQVLSRPRKI